MTTTTTRPAAPARRGFLALLTGAIAAPAAALPATATTTGPLEPIAESTAEAPELLKLGEQLSALQPRLKAATARMRGTTTKYAGLKPALPPELISLVANRLTRWSTEDGQHLFRWRPIAASIIEGEISRHTKEGKRLRRIVRLAKRYEADLAEARSISGIDAAMSEMSDILVALDALIEAMRELRPATLAGAMIYIRAGAMRLEIERERGDNRVASIADLACGALAQIADGGAA